MGSFLKKILEPSEQDAFDHLTWTGEPFISIFEELYPGDVLPSPNVGLPSPLIPRQPPAPAYVTHTGPLVRMLRQQERPGRARPAEPRREPRRARARERSPARGRGGRAAGTEGTRKEKSSLPPPGARLRILFATSPSTVLPRGSPACSSKRE